MRPTALDRHKEQCGIEFCTLHAESPAMAALLRDLLPMVEDWADGGDDEAAQAAADRISAILNRIDGRG